MSVSDANVGQINDSTPPPQLSNGGENSFLAQAISETWGPKANDKPKPGEGAMAQFVRQGDDAVAALAKGDLKEGKSDFGVDATEARAAEALVKAGKAQAQDKPPETPKNKGDQQYAEAVVQKDGSIEFGAWLDNKTRYRQTQAAA